MAVYFNVEILFRNHETNDLQNARDFQRAKEYFIPKIKGMLCNRGESKWTLQAKAEEIFFQAVSVCRLNYLKGKVENRGKYVPYFMGVASRIALNQFKYRERSNSISIWGGDKDHEEGEMSPFIKKMNRQAMDDYEKQEWKEEVEEMMKAIKYYMTQLSKDQQEVLKLYYTALGENTKERRLKEIALILEKSESCVKQLHRRAKVKLRGLLEGHLRDVRA